MFTKLFSSITNSSIWNEDNITRIVWITMLAMANKNGYVSASVGGLAHESRVTREECDMALKKLSDIDPDSRSKEFEGRRILIVDGGFQLLNHAKYRAMRSEDERKDYMASYMVEYRKKTKLTKNVNKNVNNVSESKPPLAQAEAEAEERRGDKIREEYTESFEVFWKSYPKKVGKGGAYNEWRKIPVATHEKIMTSLEVQKLSRQWCCDGGKFIPNPQTWLHQKRWDDELEGAKPKETDFSDWTNKTFR